MESYLPKWGLQILIKTFLNRMYILFFDFKYWKKFHFFQKNVWYEISVHWEKNAIESKAFISKNMYTINS